MAPLPAQVASPSLLRWRAPPCSGGEPLPAQVASTPVTVTVAWLYFRLSDCCANLHLWRPLHSEASYRKQQQLVRRRPSPRYCTWRKRNGAWAILWLGYISCGENVAQRHHQAPVEPIGHCIILLQNSKTNLDAKLEPSMTLYGGKAMPLWYSCDWLCFWWRDFSGYVFL